MQSKVACRSKHAFSVIAFSIYTLTAGAGGQVHTKGQFWTSSYAGNDAASGMSDYESTAGYIPTLSFGNEFASGNLLDIEWAYRAVSTFSGDSLINDHYKNHRLWIRYVSESLDVRLGLQKIIFGPAQVLSALSWFDTFDLTDPTGQTAGVSLSLIHI